MARIDAFLKLGTQQGCSDIHLAVGVPPMLRLHGDLVPIKFRDLRDTELEGYISEILTPNQSEHFLRGHLKRDERVISNVVMMGMGEPLQNYSALVPALRVMLDDHGYGLSRRRVTVSTSGVVPMIDRLGQDCPVALAVSLHAPNDELRDNLVPLNRKYPLAELLDACNRYLAHAPRDFITFEYCMLDGVNDQPEHARQLVELVRHHAGNGVSCKLNLIPFNPFAQSGLTRSPHKQVLTFAKILGDAGIVTTVRKTRGDDIDAACGQLAGDVKDRTRVDQRIARQRTVMLKQVPAEASGQKGT